jgi:hypothetical protein
MMGQLDDVVANPQHIFMIQQLVEQERRRISRVKGAPEPLVRRQMEHCYRRTSRTCATAQEREKIRTDVALHMPNICGRFGYTGIVAHPCTFTE